MQRGNGYFVISQQVSVSRQGNDTVKSVPEAKQQCDAGQGRDPYSCGVENECSAIINGICHNGFKQHIAYSG